MDKWEDLKSWVISGIKNLDMLANETYYPEPQEEFKRLMTRKHEFEQFLNKMNEIERIHK
jgi:hypothetical protein